MRESWAFSFDTGLHKAMNSVDLDGKGSVGSRFEMIRSAGGRLRDAIPDVDKLAHEVHLINELFISIDSELENNQGSTIWRYEFVKVIEDLEDAIDEYASESMTYDGKGGWLCYYLSKRVARAKLVGKVNVLAERIKSIAKSLELLDAKKKIRDPLPNQDDEFFFGREEDLEKLKYDLVENGDVRVVSIVGLGGMGKTTLAQKLCSYIGDQFDRVAWVSVSSKFDFRSLLLELILQLTTEEKEKVTTASSELDLLLNLHRIQLQNRYLIVLDDVWSPEAWSNLRIAFPSKDSGTRTKLLLTTRSKQVARLVHADHSPGIVHVLNRFSHHQSWDLISRIAHLPSGIRDRASWELIAKEITRKCYGLPLAINVVGKLLGTKHTLDECSALNRDMGSDKSGGEQESDGIHQLLSLSYTDLPLHLKRCFLYLAVFPEDSEIDTDMLRRLWVAEGMVRSGHGTTVESADRCLQELASRGMVQLQEDEISRVRKYRSCRLNSMIRDMCLLRAKEEKFLTVMDLRRSKKSTLGSRKSLLTGKVRKLAVHLDGNKDGGSFSFGQEKTENIRSLLLTKTYPSQYKLLEEDSPLRLKFKVLKVLHLDGLNFGAGNFPKEIQKLVFLRYLSLRNSYLEKLPSSISNLVNLETLDLRVTERCVMTIYNVLWKMGRMKHLYLPQLFRVHNDEKLRLDTLTELETLENFNSKLCFAVDLIQMINLRFLTASVHENLEDLEATIKCINKTSSYLCEASLDIRSFHCYPKGKQSAIQKLFQCNALNTLNLEGYLGELPVIATSCLSKILFSSSEFDQDPMPMLGKIPNLRVLVFCNYAFIGKKLLFPTLSFYELRHLKLSTLPNLENIIIEEGTMPKLSSLTIEECENLKLHPNQLKFFKNVKETKISGIADATGEALKDPLVI